MAVNASHLSDPTYPYDFIVSTTQGSINSGLLSYLNKGNQPITYLCFLADSSGDPTTSIDLADLLNNTKGPLYPNGVNPFDLTNTIDYSDDRFTTLTKARFVVGIKRQIGLPPGIPPNALPDIVTLGSSADTVLFNMYCSQLQVIQNVLGGVWGGGSWNIWSQPSGAPWQPSHEGSR